jgi:uncharacterized protein
MFGDASAGKSSLVKSLVPDAARRRGHRRDDARRAALPAGAALGRRRRAGGRARQRRRAVELGEAALAEAVRAHLVVYVCEGDLSRSQFEDVETLAAVGKPLVVAVNKADWYAEEDLQRIVARLAERLAHLEPPPAVVPVVAGGTERVLQADATAARSRVERRAAAGRAAARGAAGAARRRPGRAGRLRDASVFRLAAARLETAAAKRRREEAEQSSPTTPRKR